MEESAGGSQEHRVGEAAPLGMATHILFVVTWMITGAFVETAWLWKRGPQAIVVSSSRSPLPSE